VIDKARENLAVELSEIDCLGSRKETEYIGLLPPGLAFPLKKLW
jgi:hypothetical protein